MRLRPLLILAVCATCGFGLDLSGDTSYLARKLRPEWRMVSLQDALDEIAKAAEKPLQRTQRVRDQEKDALVVLVARQRWTLQEILVSLERTHALRVSAGPLRLMIETEADARDRRRRPVQINLGEFAARPNHHDLVGAPLGFSANDSGTKGGFDVFGGVAMDDHKQVDPGQVLARLRDEIEGAGMEMRANVAHLLVTPEEEKLTRALLVEQYQFAVRRGTWRATFGLLPAAGRLTTGVITREAATELAGRLDQRSDLMLALLNNQTGHAGAVRQQALVQDVEVVNGMHDPTVEVLSTGRQFQVAATRGTHFDYLSFSLQWVEPRPIRERALRLPAGSEPATLAVTAETKQDDAKPAASSANAAGPTTFGGQRGALQLPEVWSWKPRGDVMLPRGQALVLCAPHGEQTAVIICAEVL